MSTEPPASLSAETLKIAPFGDPTCRVCKLPAEELQQLHNLKFQEKYTYKQLAQYLSERKLMGKCYKALTQHFKRHTTEVQEAPLKEAASAAVHAVIAPAEMVEVAPRVSDQQVEKAYYTLVNMTVDFSKQIEKLSRAVDQRMENKELVDAELKSTSAIDLLIALAKLQNLSISHVATLSSIRTPKIVVSQMFRLFVDETIREFNELLLSTFRSLKNSAAQALLAGKMDNTTFDTILRDAAAEYKNRVLLLRQDHVAKVNEALANLEKMA